jgi:hypothetical protein
MRRVSHYLGEELQSSDQWTAFEVVLHGTMDRSRLSAKKPEAARWKELDRKFPVLKDGGGRPPPPPADFKMPELAI